MTKTMRKVQVGDTLVRHSARAGYWSGLAVGQTATVDRIEKTYGGAYVELYNAAGEMVFRGAPTVRVHLAA